MATAVYHNSTVAVADQRWNLITPVATMAEAAMQQDHGRAGPIRCVPDPSPVVFDVVLIIGDWQWRSAVRFKPAEVIVVNFYFDLLISLSREGGASRLSLPQLWVSCNLFRPHGGHA